LISAAIILPDIEGIPLFSLGHSLPVASTMQFDARRQAAAVYANYGPTAEDQLHQLQQHHGQQSMRHDHHPASVC